MKRNQCAHCSQQFGDHIGLKRHIDLRRCLRFQASKPPQPWVLSHNEDTMDLILGLHPHLWIADETLMKRLRGECALCGRKFDTPPSLMLHIEHEHGREHRAAQPYAAHLLRYFHMAGAPCLCGQWLPPSITHNCVVTTQLGILRQKASQITPRPIHAMIPCLMDQWLTEDDMESVLSHPEYEYIFTNYCGVCLTRVHSAGDLWDHLEHYHDHMMAVGIQEVDRFNEGRSSCCPACSNVSAQVRSQAPKCPFLLNCFLLKHLRNDVQGHGGDRSRHPGRAQRGVPAPDRRLDLQHWLQSGDPLHSPVGQTTETTFREWGTSGRSWPQGTMYAAGETSSSTRRRAELDLPGYQLGGVHEQGQERHPAASDGHHQIVALTTPATAGTIASANTTGECNVGRAQGTPPSNADHQDGHAGLDSLSADTPHNRGHEGSRLEMGCSQAETSSYRQWWTTSDRADRDGGPDAPTQPEGRPGPTFSCHAERECPNSAGSSLATTNQCETWTLDAGSAGPAERQCAVAVPSVPTTSMEPAAIHPCSTSPEKYAKGLPRSSIQSTILGLKLVNPANQCWTNSSIMAWLWTTLAARDVAWTDFGLGADKVSHLLAQNPAGGLNLFDLGFNPQDWRGDVQQDSSEYVSLLFSHLGPPRYDHRWEQRILVRETSETLLASEQAAPVILGLGAKTTTLQDLADQWSSAENTIVAFCHASTFKVFQLDRVIHTDSGEPLKLCTELQLNPVVHLPCFLDTEGVYYELIPYVPVSCIFHSGNAHGGHLQSGLRCDPECWWSTNDERIACEQPGLLQQTGRDLVQVWLIRQDHRGPQRVIAPIPDVEWQLNRIARHMCLGQFQKIYTNEALQFLLRSRCLLCGQSVFRWEDLMDHQRLYHGGYLIDDGPMQTYRGMLEEMQIIPCRWCSSWSVEHECQPLWQCILAVQTLRSDRFNDPPELQPPPTDDAETLACAVAALASSLPVDEGDHTPGVLDATPVTPKAMAHRQSLLSPGARPAAGADPSEALAMGSLASMAADGSLLVALMEGSPESLTADDLHTPPVLSQALTSSTFSPEEPLGHHPNATTSPDRDALLSPSEVGNEAWSCRARLFQDTETPGPWVRFFNLFGATPSLPGGMDDRLPQEWCAFWQSFLGWHARHAACKDTWQAHASTL